MAGYAAKLDAPAVLAAASALSVEIDLHTASQTTVFEYEHPLAVPTIIPSMQLIERGETIQLSTRFALRFGMVDGDSLVQAEAAVYDPQSAFQPALFRSNGSEAERLAIVCNRREAARLGGALDLDSAVRQIADRDQAAVVIVKHGQRGCQVYEGGTVHHEPARRTSTVWPIGSGDVFSAAFAKSWIVDGATAIEAARQASHATAWYCESRTFPTPDSLARFAPPAAAASGDNRPLVYLAGPFFNMMQRWMIRQARAAVMDLGMQVFSPLHDVGHGTAEDVAEKDLEGLERCGVVLALCDGLDAGTLFEVGYARKLGIPVVAFVQNETEESLKMLRGSGCQVVGDFASAVYQLAWAVNE